MDFRVRGCASPRNDGTEKFSPVIASASDAIHLAARQVWMLRRAACHRARIRATRWLLAMTNLSSQSCPTGKSLLIFRNDVKPRLQKYFCFFLTQISSLIRTVSFRQEGRIAIVTNAGRDAVDAGSALDEWC
jgi:hypothetical protein